ncbi:hypothetical protein L1987_48299 [Smallanthus sonchifolius]|uniref:Uncharacterized protein n=1 Tax=Smallanthus sonchifolius TaxID=185202 RepID=A0ACB9FRM4_9ASTR|nr:hypothetical protein L1987_48299 [Smallanthus sonchifolius]
MVFTHSSSHHVLITLSFGLMVMMRIIMDRALRPKGEVYLLQQASSSWRINCIEVGSRHEFESTEVIDYQNGVRIVVDWLEHSPDSDALVPGVSCCDSGKIDMRKGDQRSLNIMRRCLISRMIHELDKFDSRK